jgi:hypothetical protein
MSFTNKEIEKYATKLFAEARELLDRKLESYKEEWPKTYIGKGYHRIAEHLISEVREKERKKVKV